MMTESGKGLNQRTSFRGTGESLMLVGQFRRLFGIGRDLASPASFRDVPHPVAERSAQKPNATEIGQTESGCPRTDSEFSRRTRQMHQKRPSEQHPAWHRPLIPTSRI